MSFVEVRDIFQSYGGRPILERVSLDATEGEFVSIVGASGCGKSTFLRLLLDQERPTRGGITVDGMPLKGEPDRSRGIVFQRYSVFPHLSVRDNIVAAEGLSRPLGRLFGSVKRAARTRRRCGAGADRARPCGRPVSFGAVGRHAASGLPSRRRWPPSRASCLLDEPFGALDPGTREQMHEFLKDLRTETRMTVFMVTHDLPEAFKLGDRVLVFDKVRWDPHDPAAYGATITYDFDARNGGIPFQLRDDTHPAQVLAAAVPSVA